MENKCFLGPRIKGSVRMLVAQSKDGGERLKVDKNPGFNLFDGIGCISFFVLWVNQHRCCTVYKLQ